MARRLPLWLLCGWTVIVWGGRLRNIVADTELTSQQQLWRFALAGSCLVLTAWVLFAFFRGDRAEGRPARRMVGPTLVLAGWTTTVWIFRSVGIVLADHDAAFVAVHLVLAVVSMALAAWSVKQLVSVRRVGRVPAG